MNINSVNASTPNHGCTVRYCAPELLDVEGARAKKKLTAKSDVYSLSMVVVEVRRFPKVRTSGFQLSPFPARDRKEALSGAVGHRRRHYDLKGQTATET